MSGSRVCEGCAEEIDPKDPTLVRAGLAHGAVQPPPDGEADALFHAHCFPTDSPVWVRR
jgi:hypothetical protein